MKPLDRALYWVEYVLRHKGASHLKSSSNELNYAQYFLMDIISVIFILIAFGIILVLILKRVVLKNKNKISKRNKIK